MSRGLSYAAGILLTSAIALFGAGASPPASASLVFDLNVDGCSNGCADPGSSFGTITLTEVDADTVHVDVELSPAGVSLFIQTGAGYALTWNGPSGETVTNFMPVTGFTFLGYDAGGYHTGGGFGDFTYAIQCEAAPNKDPNPSQYCASKPGGGHGQYSELSFDVNLAPALALNDFSSTSKGFYFSVDLMGPSGNTGVVAARTFTEQPDCTPGAPECTPPSPDCTPGTPECTPTVPEPGTLVLLGMALVGAAVGGRRRITTIAA